MRRIASLTGLTRWRLLRIRRGQVTRIRRSTAAAILERGLTPAYGIHVPGARARQLLKWLRAEGFSTGMLRARLGLGHHWSLKSPPAGVTLRTELTLAAFRRRLNGG